MFREDLAAKAKTHYEDVKVRLAAETAQSIANSTVYGPNVQFTREHLGLPIVFSYIDTDSVSALFESTQPGEHVCVWNYASYKHPGGYFLGGSTAQEEALCHESNLYPILVAFDETYYKWNRDRRNKSMYLNRALYTPNVVFEHNGETRVADVLTCAAPNIRSAGKYYNMSVSCNNAILRDRMEFAFGVLDEHDVDTLIAGAWGCGVFGQDAYTVGYAMADSAKRHNVVEVVAAIPNAESTNYQRFVKGVEECLNR